MKFVSEAYHSNLSLDEDQMPHDLQPEDYAYRKRHQIKDSTAKLEGAILGLVS